MSGNQPNKCRPEGDRPSTAEMMECLRRSGYLLESQVVRRLTESGFFVEPNQSMQDERTGKSREVDVLAEFYNYNPDRQGVCVKTNFVMEIINNTYPFVLLTRRPLTPNTPSEYYLRYMTTPKEDAPDHFLGSLNIDEVKGLAAWKPFSQYCAFTRKKDGAELMAHHPDDVHTSLLKLAEFSLDAVADWDKMLTDDRYWRLFFWQPILVLRGNLFVLDADKQQRMALKSASSGRLEYNLHYRDRPETISIDVVTEPHLVDHLMDYVRSDDGCAAKICEARSKRFKKGPNHH